MPEEPDEFERAWARIVADLTSGEDPVGPDRPGLGEPANGTARWAAGGSEQATDWPTADTGARESAPDDVDPPTDAGTPAGLPGRRVPARGRPGGDPPSTPGDPGEFVENWADEGHFTPPTPPDLPVGTPVTRLAWAATLGGPLTLVLIALTGWSTPRVVPIVAGIATLAGFVTLVWRLPQSREDGWDDGAQV